MDPVIIQTLFDVARTLHDSISRFALLTFYSYSKVIFTLIHSFQLSSHRLLRDFVSDLDVTFVYKFICLKCSLSHEDEKRDICK
jgi:hypothetical protein